MKIHFYVLKNFWMCAPRTPQESFLRVIVPGYGHATFEKKILASVSVQITRAEDSWGARGAHIQK